MSAPAEPTGKLNLDAVSELSAYPAELAADAAIAAARAVGRPRTSLPR